MPICPLGAEPVAVEARLERPWIDEVTADRLDMGKTCLGRRLELGIEAAKLAQ